MGKVTAVTFFLGLITVGNCGDIVLNACTCSSEVDCGTRTGPDSNFSNSWTSFYDEADVVSTVRLGKGRNECGTEHISEKITINFLDPLNAYPFNGELYGNLEDSGSSVHLHINEDGILSFIPNSTQRLEQLNRESYCVRRRNESHSTIEICCGMHSSCIRKCCPYGYVFTNDFQNPCNESKQEGWNLPKMFSNTRGYYIEGDSILSKSKIRTGFPDCQKLPYNLTSVFSTALNDYDLPQRPYVAPPRTFRIYDDGTIKLLSSGGPSKLKWESKPKHVSYCVDTLAVPEDLLDFTCGKDEQDVLIICSEPHVPKFSPSERTYRIIYMAGFAISLFFLLLTAAVHLFLWEKQNIHALTILCYVLSLIGFYICLLIIFIDETRKRYSAQYEPFIPEEFCSTLGMITHFMGVNSFAWLSIINFDLWWTFRVLKPMNQRNFDWKRLVCYSSFALSVPTAVVTISVVMQIRYKQESELCRTTEADHTIYPRYGEDGCFLANSSQPSYFYLPVGILLLANLIFYLCTSCQMLKIYNATRRISSDRSSRKEKQSCKLFLKLFLVMGITWISQVILAFLENEEQTWYSPFVVLLDLANLFQPIAIFIIFVCKRETLRALEQKLPCLKPILHPVRGLYRKPTILSRSTDGSTKMSRAELTKHNSIESSSGSDHYRQHQHQRRDRDSELISFS